MSSRLHPALLLVALGLFASDARAADEPDSCGAQFCAAGGLAATQPVGRRGMQLWQGHKPFRFVGVNTYWLAGITSDKGHLLSTCDFEHSSDNWQGKLDKFFSQLVSLGVNSVRFWAYQGYAGASGRDFTFMDRILVAARRYGIYLVPVLIDRWKHCQPIGDLTDDFFDRGYRKAQRPYALAYRDYVAAISRHYAREPQILMWQIGNELMAGSFETAKPNLIRNFACDISTLLKANAPQTLVSFGTIGENNQGVGGWGLEDYLRLHTCPNIDLVEAHDYNEVEAAMSVPIRGNWGTAIKLNKPFFVGEMGVDTQVPHFAELAEQKLRAGAEAGFAGYMLWLFDPRHPPKGYDFGAGAGDRLANMLRENARAYAKPYPAAASQQGSSCGRPGALCSNQAPCCDGRPCRPVSDPKQRLGIRLCGR